MHRDPSPELTVPLTTIESVLGITVAVARERFARLTCRERQVAELMASGKSNHAIAEEMGITTKTLDIHRNSVKIKLIARTAAEIANLVHAVQLADAV